MNAGAKYWMDLNGWFLKGPFSLGAHRRQLRGISSQIELGLKSGKPSFLDKHLMGLACRKSSGIVGLSWIVHHLMNNNRIIHQWLENHWMDSSPRPQPKTRSTSLTHCWDSMQISFLRLQHRCKAQPAWSHMESLSSPKKIIQHLRRLVLRLAIFFFISVCISEIIWSLWGVFLAVEYADERISYPFRLSPWSFHIFSTFHNFHHP